MKAVRWVLVLVLGFALVLSGCGGGTSSNKPASKPDASKSSASTPAPVQTPAKEKVNVTMAVGGAPSSMIFLVPVFAQSAKFFDEEAVTLTLSEQKGGPQAAQALVSGEADFAAMALDHAVKAKAQGVDLVAVALYTKLPTVTLIVASQYKDKVKTPADLKGFKIGITSPGSGSHKALLSVLEKSGVKASEVEIIGVGTSTMPEALLSGKIQAAANYDPFITQVVSTGKAFVLVDLRTKKDTVATYGDEYPFVALVTRRDMLDKKPDLVERVVRATVKADKFLSSNTPEAIAAKLPAEIKGSDEALYISALKNNLEAIAADGTASTKGLQIVIDGLKKDNTIPADSNITPATIWDGRFLGK